MKNIVSTSVALVCFSVMFLFTSCEKENLDDTNTVITTDPQGNGGDEFDCPDAGLNYGDLCEGEGFTGVLDQNCDCIEITLPEDDCPGLGNIGDPCQGGWGTITADCDCVENDQEFDCPELQANVGDYCSSENTIGVVDENCDCDIEEEEEETYDCPDLSADIGDSCQTALGLGVVSEDCECVDEEQEFDCPNFLANIGDPCQGGWGIITEDCDCIENPD